MTIINRENIIDGPGSIKLGAVTMFDRDNIEAKPEIESYDVPSSAFGNLDTRLKDSMVRITFRPVGDVTANILAALYPAHFATPTIGAKLFGATDVPTEVHSLAGKKVTFHSTALVGLPSLKLSSVETAFAGQAEILALTKNGVARTTANSLYTIAAAAWAGTFDVANIKGGVYTGVWGTGEGSTTFQSEEGWDIDFEIQTTPRYIEGLGTYNLQLDGVTVRAKCRPVGLAEDAIFDSLALQGAAAELGKTMRSGKNLVISGGGITATLYEVALHEGPLVWGRNELRTGEIGFVAHRALASGVPGALFSIALTA